MQNLRLNFLVTDKEKAHLKAWQAQYPEIKLSPLLKKLFFQYLAKEKEIITLEL